MNTPPAQNPPAGWYPDPYDGTKQRYWDGTTWTEHVAPGVVGRPDPLGMVPPEYLVQRESRLASWARIGFVLLYAATCVSLVANVGQLSGVHDLTNRATTFGFSTFDSTTGAWAIVGLIAGFVALGANIVLLIWLLAASQASHRLGIPAVRSAGWAAAGFLVPVVNLWFPYQGVRDLFAPDDPHRVVAGRWWLFHIGGTVISLLFVLTYLTSTAVAAVLAGVAAMSTIMAGMTVYALPQAALDHHCRLANVALPPR